MRYRFPSKKQGKFTKPQSLSLSVKASSVYYNGKLKDVIRNYNWTFTLKKLQTKRILFTIEENEYMTKLADQRTVIVDASAMNGDDIYQVIERFTLLSPQLEIELPSTVERNSEFNMSVSFKNPLNQTLKSCSLIVEGKGYRRKTFNVSDVNALGTSNTTLTLSTSGVNKEIFTVTLYTAELKESVNFANVEVSGKLVLRFRKYTRKSKMVEDRRHIY
ncbi:protein-glutamine gamma-glutamyltransferase 2-like protein [Leptotrombidium deliense]|uniref:Protein-glutamine gamma-glutamyltransferase 2-like protein n=1 Tax=Leptotrombidium deliense TaxID=299467 RepID=A0A443S8J6_9ACAR|nr:protein-glutamine gamma-glutamyltransferase 2-like protein [Leptotrombidium deliense]